MKLSLRIATIEVDSEDPQAAKAVIDSVREAFNPQPGRPAAVTLLGGGALRQRKSHQHHRLMLLRAAPWPR